MLHRPYVDLEAAFDSVDHLALWKVLRFSILVQLLEGLCTRVLSHVYEQMGSCLNHLTPLLAYARAVY